MPVYVDGSIARLGDGGRVFVAGVRGGGQVYVDGQAQGGGGGVPTPQEIMGDDFVESFLAEAATSVLWPGDSGSFSLSVLSGVPVPQANRFGARDMPAVELTSDYYISTEAGLGNLLSGAVAPPFAWFAVFAAGTTTASRVMGGWGSVVGGTAGPYADVWSRTNGFATRFHRVANTNLDIDAVLAGYAVDTRERAMGIIYEGAGGVMTIVVRDYSRLASQPGWQVLYSAVPADPSSLLGITHFILGGRLAGTATPATPINPQRHAEHHIASAALDAGQIALMQSYLDSRYEDTRPVILPTRTQIISSATPTFNGADGANIMFGSLVKAASWHVAPLGAYYCLFGDHDGTFIRVAYANSVTGPWTVVSSGTSITLAALNAAGGYSGGTHVSSPEVVVDEANSRYLCYLHGDSTGLGHESVLAESIDLVTWTFVGAGARLSNGTGMLYVRPFEYNGEWYGVSDTLILFHSATPTIPGTWTRQSTPDQFRGPNGVNGRHAGCVVRGDSLVVLWTNRSEFGEHIHYASLDMSAGGWDTWVMGEGADLIWPYTDADGADLPWTLSGSGAATARERSLRDPGIFIDPDDGTHWLVYAQAGEDALAVVNITTWLDDNFPVP